jgi:hypothetical protein
MDVIVVRMDVPAVQMQRSNVYVVLCVAVCV